MRTQANRAIHYRTKAAMLAGVAVLSLGGCYTYSLEELRNVAPSGTPFQRFLADHYRAYAEQEAREYDWADSSYFATKGLQFAYGNSLPPEDPNDWDIHEPVKTDLLEARKRLMDVLPRTENTIMAEMAAKTQFYYDCWIEQQEEMWQDDDIVYCRDAFERHLQSLYDPNDNAWNSAPSASPSPSPSPALGRMIDEMIIEEEIINAPPSSVATPVRPPKPAYDPNKEAKESVKMPEINSYLLYFAWQASAPNTRVNQLLDELAQDMKDEPDYTIILNGHTDRSGEERYNFDLSNERATNIKRALIQRGIPAERIQTYGFGETDLRKATKDGRLEPENRRVEVYFHEAKP